MVEVAVAVAVVTLLDSRADGSTQAMRRQPVPTKGGEQCRLTGQYVTQGPVTETTHTSCAERRM